MHHVNNGFVFVVLFILFIVAISGNSGKQS